jgi:hypothetical protein
LFPCPSAGQAQRDPVARAHGAQIAQEYFERQHRQLDELQNLLNNREAKRATSRAIPCGPPAEGRT